MRKRPNGALLLALLAMGGIATTYADSPWDGPEDAEDSGKRSGHHRSVSKDHWSTDHHERWNRADTSFQRIATLPIYANNGDLEEETVSEIIAVSDDGVTLVYTDGPLQQIGFVDIGDAHNPIPAGVVPLVGEPTSVDVLGDHYALVAVNTSADFVDTSGELVVVDILSRKIVGSIDLGGQPDSVKISPDGRYAAVAIENERNEELCVGGTNSGTAVPEDDDLAAKACVQGGGAVGVLPQTAGSAVDTNGNLDNPPGYLAIVEIRGKDPADWKWDHVELTGLASYAPEDPEPEFVDINEHNEAVVTLQENNYLVIVDLAKRKVVKHFDLGTVTLEGVDATEDGTISLTDTLVDLPREPDAVAWVPAGHRGRHVIATANEGDLFGGSRGFSLFDRRGGVLFDSSTSLEEIAVGHGHYPEERSENKGSEPEAIEFGRIDHRDYLFVGSERGSFIAVYRLLRHGWPKFEQLLPGPLGPEGLLAIPDRKLLIASGEEDDPAFGVRSTLMIYQLKDGDPSYPQIISAGPGDSPTPWSALSGMVAVPWDTDTLLAVWDSFCSTSNIFRIDVSSQPAQVIDAMSIQGGSGDYDPEGIAIAPDGTLWIASEGNASDERSNRLLQVDRYGNVVTEVGLPGEILACRAASESRGTLGSGFEGVAIWPKAGGNRYQLLVAQQRGWDYTTPECEHLDDDTGGLNANDEPNRTRIWIYDPHLGHWDHVAWELAPLPANASWVGLSEITQAPDGSYVVLERDNRTGDFTAIKTLVRVQPESAFDGLVSASDKSVFDLLPKLMATNGWITDKPEGVAITDYGRTYLVTDNDGVDDWSGETWFLDLGDFQTLFPKAAAWGDLLRFEVGAANEAQTPSFTNRGHQFRCVTTPCHGRLNYRMLDLEPLRKLCLQCHGGSRRNRGA